MIKPGQGTSVTPEPDDLFDSVLPPPAKHHHFQTYMGPAIMIVRSLCIWLDENII